MEETISLIDILKTIKKRWKLIAFLTIAAAVISGVISFYVLTPVYQASTLILVNQRDSENKIDLSQINSNVELINTYSVIVKSPRILEKVKEKYDLKQSISQLEKNILVNSQGESQVFSLTVTNEDPKTAVKIANAVSVTFQDEIKGIMNVDNVSILAKAELPKNPDPVKPDPYLNIAIALVIGLMAGIGLAFLSEYLDNTLKNGSDVEMYLGLPVLGTIQKLPAKLDSKELRKHRMGEKSIES